MESYGFGKYGLFLETGSNLSPVFLGIEFGEVVMARNNGVIKLHPMLAHILSNTIDGMMSHGIFEAEVSDDGISVKVYRQLGILKITAVSEELELPDVIASSFAQSLASIIPIRELHWLPHGQVPIFLEPDNGIVPAPAGEDPLYKPSFTSLLVVGNNFCGCKGGHSSLSTCSPRCHNCFAMPSYKSSCMMFFKYGGGFMFFKSHPLCN